MAIDVEQLYRRHGPMVLRRCRAILKDEELAVEAMHEVFVSVVRFQGRIEERGTCSLLYRMATNTSLNLIRSRRRRPEDADDEVIHKIASVDDAELRTLSGRLLDRIFGREPESTRTIAVLHLVDGMTLEEVAREVGLSVSGVRKRLRTLQAHVAELEVA